MSSTTTPTALIVDDNFYNRDLASLALRHVGYEVAEAENGQDALDMLAVRTYDLLILDLAMPRLSGIDVVNALHEQARHKGMRIVVMTANPHMATSDVSARVDFVIYKPIDVNQFASLADRLTRRSIFI